MNKEKFKNYTFENDVLHYKSFINEFTSKVFKEFDSKAEKLGLTSKIEDLFVGNKVNYTEGLAAWHPRYREKNNSIYITFNTSEIFKGKKSCHYWHRWFF